MEAFGMLPGGSRWDEALFVCFINTISIKTLFTIWLVRAALHFQQFLLLSVRDVEVLTKLNCSA